MHFKLAILNTFRNRRRAILNVVMIAGGVSGMIVFEGFAHYVLDLMQKISTNATYGHVQIARESFWEKSARSPKENLLADGQKLSDALAKVPGVVSAAGRISFFGLIGNEESTVGARAFGIDPVAEKDVIASYRIVAGETLTGAETGEPRVLLGAGLAKTVGTRPGESLTVLGFTYDKVINAIDVTVQGVFETSIAEVDDSVFVIPLVAAQRLLDTERVEKMVIRLDRTDRTDAALGALQASAAELDPGLRSHPWHRLDRLYTQVKDFFDIQNRIIEAIIVSLVLLGILNTLGMSVFERTGEIGTMRSLGSTRRQVIAQFLAEGLILAATGIVIGTGLGVVLAHLISGLGLEVVLPNASRPIPIRIDLFAGAFFTAWALTFLAALLASVIPAYRITRMRIVDALRHNI